MVLKLLGKRRTPHSIENTAVGRSEPRHTDIVQNVTVVQGRDALLSCHVENVENYKIAWVRVKTQTILSLNNKLISRNHRFEVSTTDSKEWNLKIRNVKPSDRGWYMCQINTDPMKSQTGYLEITQPPRILVTGTSSDLTINEGYPARLTCYASGHPMPTITWKREDGQPISKQRICKDLIIYNL
ncbi:HNT [Lepeophtheirus salmonis]|uniref:HNT n=1 Tax=Lepeophtheirus salmonis TaxID=72036 RepID=A0A7R8HDG4_LEPSM|nr:HNT [Lepeophtheirus salmonis]CAF3008678.1 HNT [Lepeophtheirus salmonis]